ncbi:hypothetical protein GMRT_14548 [Giardia muris]|uniref:Uncharacterized protein n=1 Tax=Giardia muris TaxID=5742 RepID=A0A4Z1T7E0_GIAMU|nr:hypothetical protein GMRT_14548 [Giardia muris]|eukprot:TNJ29057.1 hypothetical protein GMRT_14548 [Giardia muris]
MIRMSQEDGSMVCPRCRSQADTLTETYIVDNAVTDDQGQLRKTQRDMALFSKPSQESPLEATRETTGLAEWLSKQYGRVSHYITLIQEFIPKKARDKVGELLQAYKGVIDHVKGVFSFLTAEQFKEFIRTNMSLLPALSRKTPEGLLLSNPKGLKITALFNDFKAVAISLCLLATELADKTMSWLELTIVLMATDHQVLCISYNQLQHAMPLIVQALLPPKALMGLRCGVPYALHSLCELYAAMYPLEGISYMELVTTLETAASCVKHLFPCPYIGGVYLESSNTLTKVDMNQFSSLSRYLAHVLGLAFILTLQRLESVQVASVQTVVQHRLWTRFETFQVRITEQLLLVLKNKGIEFTQSHPYLCPLNISELFLRSSQFSQTMTDGDGSKRERQERVDPMKPKEQMEPREPREPMDFVTSSLNIYFSFADADNIAYLTSVLCSLAGLCHLSFNRFLTSLCNSIKRRGKSES